MERFILQKSEDPGYWVCTDQQNGIVCKFEQGNFNGNQKITQLEDSSADAMAIARSLREMADWLNDNHSDKIF